MTKKLYIACALFTLFSISVNAQSVVFFKGTQATVQSGVTVYIQGGINLTNGANVTVNGNIVLENGNTVSNTPWYDSTATGAVNTTSTGNVVFANMNNQIIYGPTQFTNLEFNTPSTVNLSNDVTVTNTLKLTNGVVNTGNYKIMVTSTAGSAVVAGAGNTNYTQSWINGNLRRYMATNSANYDFPVGSASQANLATLTNHSLVGITYLDGAFTAKPGTDVGLTARENGTFYLNIHNNGVWVIEPNQQPTGGSYDMACYVNGFGGLTDNQFALLKRPATSTKGSDWATYGGTLNANGGSGRLVADGYALRKGFTSFSQFGIGVLQHALPISLVSFDARNENNTSVITEWIVASQHNNHVFNVQRSTDATEFTTIGTVEGCGTCHDILTYTFDDAQPLSGTIYYRLQQVDYDGMKTYSKTVMVNMQENKEQTVHAYPNPTTSDVQLDVTGKTGDEVVITINGIAGNEVMKSSVILNSDMSHLIMPTRGIPAGMYMIHIYNIKSGKTSSIKIVKE